MALVSVENDGLALKPCLVFYPEFIIDCEQSLS